MSRFRDHVYNFYVLTNTGLKDYYNRYAAMEAFVEIVERLGYPVPDDKIIEFLDDRLRQIEFGAPGNPTTYCAIQSFRR